MRMPVHYIECSSRQSLFSVSVMCLRGNFCLAHSDNPLNARPSSLDRSRRVPNSIAPESRCNDTQSAPGWRGTFAGTIIVFFHWTKSES